MHSTKCHSSFLLQCACLDIVGWQVLINKVAPRLAEKQDGMRDCRWAVKHLAL